MKLTDHELRTCDTPKKPIKRNRLIATGEERNVCTIVNDYHQPRFSRGRGWLRNHRTPACIARER